MSMTYNTHFYIGINTYMKSISTYTEIKVVCKCFPGRHGDLPLQCSVGATLRGRPFLEFANHFMISILKLKFALLIISR